MNTNVVSPYKSSSATTSELRVLLDNGNLLRLKEYIFKTFAKQKGNSNARLTEKVKLNIILPINSVRLTIS